LIDALPKHPGFEAAVGAGFSKTMLRQDEAVRGTDRAGAESMINQLKGSAFLSAIQQMKGMGALSNAEGEKAAMAIARLDANQSEEDFKKALSDYRAIIEKGMQKIQESSTTVPPVQSETDRLRGMLGR